MNVLLLAATIILLGSIPTSSASAHWGRDSVIFDGDESAYPLPPQEAHCVVRVVQLTGTAKGLVMIREKVNTCGVVSFSDRWKVKKLTVGDEVSVNEAITTDPGSSLTLQTDAGAIIEVFGDSHISMGDVCGQKPKPILIIKAGGAKITDRPSPPRDPDEEPEETPPPPGPEETPPPPGPDDAPPIITHTPLLKVVPKGTTYSVRTTGKDADGETVVRVYLGSDEVFPNMAGARASMKDDALNAEALMKDFQAGRISQKELTEAMMRMSAASTKKTESLVTSVTLKAGEKCVVSARGEAGKPKKFDVSKE